MWSMMAKPDVIIIGAGAAGLSAAALLAKEGKRVILLEAGPYLGGRGMAVPEEGFKLNLGGHLLEDTGSGLTQIFRHVGKELVHGARSTDMVVWDDEQLRWGSIRDRYSGDKGELKKVIAALMDTSYEELDRWDDRPLREWLLTHTQDQGVIDLWEFLAVLECMTEEWYDHSASENLYVRKMHYEEAHMAGYSFWPGQGWDGLFEDLRDAVIENGGEIRMNTPVDTVIIEDGVLKGVVLGGNRIMPNEFLEGEVLEADCVISTLPVWSVLRVIPESALPDWYVEQIRFLAADHLRISWLGLYLATRDDAFVNDPRELATWLRTPRAGVSGFMFNQSAMDPSSAPEGVNLIVAGGIISGARARDTGYLSRQFDAFEADLKQMYPGLKNAYWRRRHLVHDPSFGVIQRPGLVGVFRPHWRAPNIEGLYFASETFRSRGIGVDRAARAGLTVTEDILGRRLPGFGWRY
jgi:phytoene dehydrogenase-like protein